MQVTQPKHPTSSGCNSLRRPPYKCRTWHLSSSNSCRQASRHRSDTQTLPRSRLTVLNVTSDRRSSAPSFVCKAKAPGIFPAGQKQATVPSPAFCLWVDAALLLKDAEHVEQVNLLVNTGVNFVILHDSTGGAALYDAALKIKDLLRDRAGLLIVDRTDICLAVGAQGILLSSQGLPVVVGRRMLQNQVALIGREASTPEDAAAAAADGANFILLKASDGSLPAPELLQAARTAQRSGNPIPIILACTTPTLAPVTLQSLLPLTPDGLALPPALLQQAAAACSSTATESPSVQQWGAAVWDVLNGRSAPLPEIASLDEDEPAGVVRESSSLRQLLAQGREVLVAEEKALLGEIVELLEAVYPQLDALPLLREAVKQLDDRFLVVVVGEFNSGKSSVINALLGARFLAEGILPTTNEVNVLRYSADPAVTTTVQRQDGLVVRHLQAELLREMNVVDTPGTNVILERQQRLTEEFVPRADLVLFVMSCDRAFTESEVKFLEYIRSWKKKIVFVVNKVDMLANEQEVQEVVQFVSGNAQRLLKLDDPFVWPVSSRLALRAKQDHEGNNGALLSLEDAQLGGNDDWQSSRFAAFERFISEFLVGGSGGRGSGEGFRLKLQTPLGVADALMSACAEYLQGEISAAERELQAVCAISGNLQRFSQDMAKDGEAQRVAVRRLVAEAVSRTDAYVDRVVKLSNPSMLSAYLLGTGISGASSFESEIVGPLYGKLRNLTLEHQAWVAANCDTQLRHYRSFIEGRSAALASSNGGNGAGSASLSAMAVQQSQSTGGSSALAVTGSTALSAVTDFDVKSAGILLEEEIREAVIGTAGTAAGASGLGLLATGMLGNTLEDLLALGVAGLASYVAVLNLPLRRAEIKKKLAGVAERSVTGVEARMEQELTESVDRSIAEVTQLAEPLQAACAGIVYSLQQQDERRQQLAQKLADLQKKIANLE